MKHKARPKRNGVNETPAVYGAPGCPRPDKRGFERRKDARRVSRKFNGKGGQVYLCVCGYFHIGKPLPGASRDHVRHHSAVAAARREGAA